MKRLALATLLLAAPALSRAQSSTQDQIDRAIGLYEAFQVEQARPLLLAVISPTWVQQVSSAQKAVALKYLGASYAVLASPDTATNYFMGALDFDPFTDLDPAKFAASELDAFNKAKAQLFKVAVRPMLGPALLRPQTGVPIDSASYTFRFISTQRSTMRISLTAQNDTSVNEELYNGASEGVRTIQWRGVLNDGRYAPAGTYVLTVAATPTRGGGREERSTMTFRLEHILEPLEDTLPTLNPNDPTQLLPTAYKPIAIWQDLIKGGFVGAVAALALPAFVDNEKSTIPHAAGAAAFVTIGAGSSFLDRRRNPEIRANVIENQRRQAVRTAFNARVRSDNAGRILRTVMVITPVTTAQ